MRAISRIFGLVVLTCGLTAIGLPYRVIELFSPRLGARWRDGLIRVWARSAARLIGMKIESHGAPPAAPCLLVTNHLSYVDIVALFARVPGVFVAKSEVAGWPMIGAVGRIIRTLFIDRERKRDLLRVLDEMGASLVRGDSVILFGEGTSSPGAQVLPFKSSLFEAAVRHRMPVACATLSYAVEPGAVPAHLSVCWWGDMTFGDHAYELLGLRRFRVSLRFAPKQLEGSDRKALARAARETVGQLFVPVHQPESHVS